MRKPAEWRKVMTDREREDQALVDAVRDAATELHRQITRRHKERCIKRLKRKEGKE